MAKHTRRRQQRAKSKTKSAKSKTKSAKSKTKSTPKTFRRVNCSPGDQQLSFSCLSSTDLCKLKYMWNVDHPHRQITATSSRAVWDELQNNYANACDNESCWVRQGGNATMMAAFAPKSPKSWSRNPNEWLSSVDIAGVMRQYESRYKCFEFLGPTPIDFDTVKHDGECVWEELCNFNLADTVRRGKTKIGVIFNTDTSDGGGEHWISMFIDLRKHKRKLFFFDSTGDTAPPEVVAFVRRIQEQGRHMSPPIDLQFDQNHPVEHQYGNTECGVYSLFFITHMLEDKITEHYLKTHVLKDEYMEQFRKVYFNPADI